MWPFFHRFPKKNSRLKFQPAFTVPSGRMSRHIKFGPARFSRFLRLLEINKQTNKQIINLDNAIFIHILCIVYIQICILKT